MDKNYVCVGGIEQIGGRHIRPVTAGMRLVRKLIESEGGPFGIGFVVDIGDTRPCGIAPLVEDVEFRPANARIVGRLDKGAFFRLLHAASKDRLRSIFGDDLESSASSLTLLPGKGTASLGCLSPLNAPELYVNQWNKIRLVVSDKEGKYDLSVTDLRLYHLEDYSPHLQRVEEMQKRLRGSTPVILSVGLTKLWTKPGDSHARHWLQVNNIHFL